MDDLMTRESAAVALGVSISTVQRMCGDGRLVAVKFSGRRAVRVTAESVQAARTRRDTPVPVVGQHGTRDAAVLSTGGATFSDGPALFSAPVPTR